MGPRHTYSISIAGFALSCTILIGSCQKAQTPVIFNPEGFRPGFIITEAIAPKGYGYTQEIDPRHKTTLRIPTAPLPEGYRIRRFWEYGVVMIVPTTDCQIVTYTARFRDTNTKTLVHPDIAKRVQDEYARGDEATRKALIEKHGAIGMSVMNSGKITIYLWQDEDGGYVSRAEERSVLTHDGRIIPARSMQ